MPRFPLFLIIEVGQVLSEEGSDFGLLKRDYTNLEHQMSVFGSLRRSRSKESEGDEGAENGSETRGSMFKQLLRRISSSSRK